MTIMSVAVIVAVGAFGNAQRANREVQDVAAVLESVSFLLEDITREAKYSTDYTCNGGFCDLGRDNVVMTRLGVNNLDKGTVEYLLDGSAHTISRTVKDEDGNIVASGNMTADNVSIDVFEVYAYTKTNPSVPEPDRMRIVIEGHVDGSDTPPVRVQTTITARM